MTHRGTRSDLESARVALDSGDWALARDRFEELVAETPTPDALEGLGSAYFWLDDPRTIEIRERAYHAYRAAGDRRGSARAAIAVAFDHVTMRGELAVGQGWLELAGRQLADEPLAPEHGLLAAWLADFAITAGDTDAAAGHADRAVEIARDIGDADIELVGRAQQGIVLVTRGRVVDGMRLLDTSAAAAVAGEISDRALAGYACCYVINACGLVHDLDRASQWCRQLDALCQRVGYHALQHLCRVEYAAVLVEQGEWTRAEEEMLRASEFLGSRRPALAVEAVARLGELRRRQGRYDEAMALFSKAEGHYLSVLGIASMALDRGDSIGAEQGADRYLRALPDADNLWRAAALDLKVRALVASGDLARAAVTLAELERAATLVGRGPMLANACLARSELHLAEGDVGSARQSAEDAIDLFGRAGAPFGAARAHAVLARAHRAAGDETAASREAAAAENAFKHLGARPLADDVRRWAEKREDGRRVLTAREIDVIRLVANGLTNAEIATHLVLSEHTVHRHVANAMAKLEVGSRAAAVGRASALGLL
jgi:LuxR family transcriptional regulator, maltose regulon positive regulatory protein